MSAPQPTLIESHNVTIPSRGAAELAGTFAGKTGAAEDAYKMPDSTSSPRSLQVNQTQKSISELMYNGTGFYIEDEMETGLNDLQTILLTSVATLIFLIVVFLSAYGIRLLWKNYRRRKENSQYDGILHREGTSESISRPLHSHLLGDKNYTNADLTVHAETVEICDSIVNSQIRSNNHSSTNGSIITMTLKNNHLIVETEERNDLEEDSRETTMKYSPGARNGVFVVEVQQGLRRSPGSGGPISCTEQEMSISVSDQCALVHNPPDRYSDEETMEEYDDSEYYIETVSPNRDTPDSITSKTKTGFTQSNTSLSHPSYCYTNQECYDISNYGYSVDPSNTNECLRRNPDDTRPKIMAAIYKNTLKRSPSTEDLHLAAINGVDEIVNDADVCRASSEDELHLEEQMRLGNVMKNPTEHSPKLKQLENDISQSSREEAETGSADCENKGFDCNDSGKS